MSNDKRRRPWVVPFLDLSNVLFFFFVSLFALALLIIGDEQTRAKVDTTSKLLIHLTWRDNSPNDVDLWLRTPAGNAIGFRNKQADFVSLDHDNLGISNGIVTDADGNVIVSPARDEVMFIRQTMPGTYVCNIHLYTQSDGPEPVTVTLTSVDPSYRVVVERKLVLADKHQENTAFRFTVDDRGNVTSTDSIEDLFVNDLLSGKS